ncbi:probable (S)-N-methylcoclaurine 3'-hydroxylase isozyme 2 [Solanum dulcamara]|uniref:probable (S)-N-methylcoclaurine 3'-hydroxylase isozyme 2 n=1 Tax=Solanum dulcamara TaxID=45834 RepID=UPI00248511E1|nr:probable (S)-N-methylcoclaurine 3'-hydroxylase isozyme 2 [Solanum dulcamara]
MASCWIITLCCYRISQTHDRILTGRDVPDAVPSKGSDLEKTSLAWKSDSYIQENWSSLLDVVYNKFASNPVKELLAAGSVTSTSTIECAMAELIKNVESMKKVQEELKIELSENDYLKESQLLQMSYVQACVKETLKLPALLLLPHHAIETCQVMSHTIPKDAQVLVNVWAITRDPLIWEDPEMFRPQRFLSSYMDFKGNDFEFLPFSAGRRKCPGMPMAAIKIPLVLGSLVHFFDWELSHGKCPIELDMTEKFGVTLQKKEPLLLIPKARK